MEKFTGYVAWNTLVQALQKELDQPSVVCVSNSEMEVLEVARVEERRFDLLTLLELLTSDEFEDVLIEELEIDDYEKEYVEFNRRSLELYTEGVSGDDMKGIAQSARMKALEKDRVGYTSPLLEKKLFDASQEIQDLAVETRASIFRAIALVFAEEPEGPKKRPEGFDELLKKMKGLPESALRGYEPEDAEEEDVPDSYGLDFDGWKEKGGGEDAA
ncbi:MAG: hypothetical protein AB7J40_05220 [Candidatus Altimarinota bacterium]